LNFRVKNAWFYAFYCENYTCGLKLGPWGAYQHSTRLGGGGTENEK